MDEREEAEIAGQLFLRDAPVGAKPGPQQGPAPFHGVDVNLAEPISVIVARVFAFGMADCLVSETPCCESRVDVVFIRIDERSSFDDCLDDRLDGLLLDVGEHTHRDLPASFDQAEDGRFLLFKRAASGRAFEPSAPASTVFF